MILDVLVFALGFMVAGLLALAALPAVWRRALRLSEERLSRLVPLSSEEIAAERDHLRAAHAVALRRVEQRLEGSEADRAVLRIAAARREAHISDLDDAAIHAQVGIAERDAAAAALREEVAGLWAGHGAEAQALDGLARLAERRLEEVAVLQAERDGLRQEVDRHRGAVAGLETRLIGAETRGGDLARDLETARREAAVAAARTAVEREAAALRPPDAASRPPEQDRAQEVAALKAELAFMVEQARSAERRATESAKALETLKAEVPDGEAKTAADPAAAAPRDDATLRAAVAALADEVMRFEARRR